MIKYVFTVLLLCIACLGAGIMPPIPVPHPIKRVPKPHMVKLAALPTKAVRVEATVAPKLVVIPAQPKTFTMTWTPNYDSTNCFTVIESTLKLENPDWKTKFMGATNAFIIFSTNQTEFFRVCSDNAVTGARSKFCQTIIGYANVVMRYR